tara:strand:+ start:1777 stop:2685 length:909 start_codon:yes stop_codon:yes gene_type:complete
MVIYKNSTINKKFKRSVIAIGNFDGLHLGHQKVLKEAKRRAKKYNLKLGVITFEPVPVMFFNKMIKNHRINNAAQKIQYLKKLKVDFIYVIKFNKKFSNLSPKKFIKKFIYNNLNCKFIFVSKNFRFGKNRTGNIETLNEYSSSFSYKLIITKPLKNNKNILSSTVIRKKIMKGEMDKVRSCLGRPWCIEGVVIKGEQRGRLIGFPTCNLKLNNYIVPRLGVYSVEVSVSKYKKRGIANIGYRPTFKGSDLLLEVNIFGIQANLYKKPMKVSFIKFLRPEKKFNDINQLKIQIQKDIIKAKK